MLEGLLPSSNLLTLCGVYARVSPRMVAVLRASHFGACGATARHEYAAPPHPEGSAHRRYQIPQPRVKFHYQCLHARPPSPRRQEDSDGDHGCKVAPGTLRRRARRDNHRPVSARCAGCGVHVRAVRAVNLIDESPPGYCSLSFTLGCEETERSWIILMDQGLEHRGVAIYWYKKDPTPGPRRPKDPRRKGFASFARVYTSV